MMLGTGQGTIEPMASFAQSICSTTAPAALEDDANSITKQGATESSPSNMDGYNTPERTCSEPFIVSTYEPECDATLQPSIGMVFDTLQEGEVFYTNYAHSVGFAVRKSSQHKGKGDELTWKRFVCSKEGWRKQKETENGHRKIPKRKINLTRSGCEAKIAFKRRNDGRYEVARFVKSHTHHFVSPDKQHLLRSNRDVSSDVTSTLFTCQKAGIGTFSAYRYLSVEKGGHANIGCTKRDLQNHVRDLKETIKAADAQVLFEILKSKKLENPAFFYEYKLDSDDKLTHLFWADATCRKNYALFGDVVSFDATYRTNRYDLVFAPFTGVNHHKSCVTFGAALIPNEKIESYTWVFQTFLKAMGDVAPKLIITDEDLSMKAVIRDLLPGTIHRLCMWHILNKLPERVGPLNQDEVFREALMSCVWSSETPDEFESKWSSIISEYGLENNLWLNMKYEMRKSWIPAYFVEFSLGGILRTTSRSESENSFFGKFLNQRLALLEFWIRFETALDEQRQTELVNDNHTLHTRPEIETPWRIEKHARDVYTCAIFKLFQKQAVAARDCCDIQNMEHVDEVQTTTIKDTNGRFREVHYNKCTKVAECSCKLYNSVGVLCSHIILVLKGQCDEIPGHYVLDRWTKMAARKHLYDTDGHLLEGSCTSLPPAIKILHSETCARFNSAIRSAKQCEEKMKYLHKVVSDAADYVLQMGTNSEVSNKVAEFESYVGMPFPKEIHVNPPDIAHTKGNGHRFRRGSEKAIKAPTNQRKKRARITKHVEGS